MIIPKTHADRVSSFFSWWENGFNVNKSKS